MEAIVSWKGLQKFWLEFDWNDCNDFTTQEKDDVAKAGSFSSNILEFWKKWELKQNTQNLKILNNSLANRIHWLRHFVRRR